MKNLKNLSIIGLLIPLCAGCAGSGYGGTYVLNFVLKDNTCSETLAESVSGVTNVGLLSTNEIVFELYNWSLVGPLEDNAFKVSDESTSRRQSKECTLQESHSRVEFSGAFTDDLGIEGELEAVTSRIVESCGAMDNVEESCSESWDVTGVLVRDEHPYTNGVLWGQGLSYQ